jgi:hypothetical protein
MKVNRVCLRASYDLAFIEQQNRTQVFVQLAVLD